MLIITVQLASAMTNEITTLGRMVIANDGTGTADKGNYVVGVKHKAHLEDLVPISLHCSREGKVLNHSRKAEVIWKLILKALKACYPEEK